MPKGKGRGRGRGAAAAAAAPRRETPVEEPQVRETRPPPAEPQQQPPPSSGRGRGRARPGSVSPEQAAAAAAPAEMAAGDPAPSAAAQVTALIPKIERLGKDVVFTQGVPKKPPPGTLGRKIALLANHFPITIPDGYVYHYDVDIEVVRKDAQKVPKGKKGPPTGRKINARLCRIIMQKVMESEDIFRKHLPAYDGHKNIITRRPLKLTKPEVLKDVLIVEGERTSNFRVTIQPVIKEETGNCAIDLDPLHAIMRGTPISSVPQEAIMALDIILRHGPSMVHVPLQRSFFYPPRDPREAPDLGGGKEVWFGYYQSLRPGQWKPMLNINKSATTFFTAQSLIDFVCTFLNIAPERLVTLDVKDIASLSKHLKTMQVEVTHLTYPRKYRVRRVTQQKANQLSFELTDKGKNVKTTVDAYFRDKHQKRLKYPNLPCIQAEPEEKKIFLPFEVCRIVSGQQNKRKLTDVQTAKMIRFTATPPAERFEDIKRAVRSTVEASRPMLKEFDIQISTDPLRLSGRVIQPPSVLYKHEKTASPSNGAWDLRDLKFFVGATINSWVVLNFSTGFCKDNHVNAFVQLLCKISQEVGMQVANPLAKLDMGRDRRPMAVIMNEVKSRYPGVNLVLVILSRFSNYSDIKFAAETREGIQTQCIKDENVVKKCNAQLVVNLLQKINAKVEGVNCSLLPVEKPAIFRRPVVILGADVTHPAPGDKLKPSVAAVVASMDSYPCRYAVSIRVQQSKDRVENKPLEIIEKLHEMVRELLLAFYRKTKYKPEKVIFYRDGVSEGQFAHVQEQEIRKLREACTSLQADYKPAITFIVVQKRHHTRFMPENFRDGTGKCKNIPPGTTVDTTVVSPLNFDFFLCSHAGIQGTSRPAHYTVLWDDNNFNADELQKLTYHLCHTYVRCTRSISIPAPVMYAHLAAFRARNHIISGTDPSSSSSESSDETAEFTLSNEILNSVIVVEPLKEQMYFV